MEVTKAITNNELFSLDQTIAEKIFDNCTYPWEVLPKIKDFIIQLGKSLDLNEFNKIGEDIWIHKSATVAPTACINGPLIVDADAEIRHCAFVRGSAIVGKNVVVGNSTELKNVILFNNVQVPHYNYVGDSILGYKSHMGAGSITSNVKSDKALVKIHVSYAEDGTSIAPIEIETGLKKIGAILGDCVEVGCNSVLNPGTIIGMNSNIYPTSSVRGFVPKSHIYKEKSHVVIKK